MKNEEFTDGIMGSGNLIPLLRGGGVARSDGVVANNHLFYKSLPYHLPLRVLLLPGGGEFSYIANSSFIILNSSLKRACAR